MIKIIPEVKNRINDLYKNGNSMKKIGKIIGIGYSSVNRHLHKEKVELKRRGNPNKISPNAKELTLEKAYVLGVIGPGDGFIENYNGCRIALEATDLDFINYFAYCLEKVYEIKPRIKELKVREGDSKPHFKVRIYSKEAYDDILAYKVDMKEKTWRVPQAVKEASNEVISKYLQGFADSQGCVSKRAIILCNQNKEGLKDIQKLLNRVGINNVRQGKAGLILCSRKEVELFSELINFSISYKRDKLRRVVKDYQVWKTPQEEIRKVEPRIVELRQKGFSYPVIAKECGISLTTAWRYSKHLGINHVNQYF